MPAMNTQPPSIKGGLFKVLHLTHSILSAFSPDFPCTPAICKCLLIIFFKSHTKKKKKKGHTGK